MTLSKRSLLRWTPRALGVLYVAFISLFALDVWGTGAGFWNELAGFLVHLMPAYFVAAALVIAWKSPRLGGILFIILATAFGLIFGWRDPVTLLLLALPPTATGLLFICDGCLDRTELQPRI